jgi:hypothetical protein
MNAVKGICFWMILGFSIMLASATHAAEVTYTLENVILDDSNAQMFGTFSWTYDIGDFENGVGEFSFLDIPFTSHDHTDLEAEFDIENSIEITLPGSVHDDGVDITLFLMEPLTPTTSSSIDLDRSRYEIGGNGFHTGFFLSGEIVLSAPTGVGDETAVAAPRNMLSAYPNPFNPHTTVTYILARPSLVRLSIHDVQGRRVATLADGAFSDAGEISFQWNGRDSNGADVSSGIYFARMVSGEHRETRKMVLLR